MGVHLTIEVSIFDCAITNVIIADRHINDKAVIAIKTKVHKLNITLLVACGRRRRHLVIDAHRVACVVGQLRQDIHDIIVASGGSRVLFASKDVILMEVLLTTCKTCDPSLGRLALRTYLRDPQWLLKESNNPPP